ncbi:MAG: nucleotidyltransferase family protein [Chlamydiia bacterium]
MGAPSRDEVWKLLRFHAPFLQKQYGLGRIGIFGSWARQEETALSDIDILVEWDNPTFRGYFALKSFLESVLGWKVDLVIAHALKPAFKDRILAEVVYAA